MGDNTAMAAVIPVEDAARTILALQMRVRDLERRLAALVRMPVVPLLLRH